MIWLKIASFELVIVMFFKPNIINQKQSLVIILCLFGWLLFSSCAPELEGEALIVEGIEALIVEEGTLLGVAAVEGNAIRCAATSEVIIANETVALSEFSRVRMATGNALAYRGLTAIAERGEEVAFVKLLNHNTIQVLKSGRILTFPNGRIYTVIGNGVNIRTGCGINYQVNHVSK